MNKRRDGQTTLTLKSLAAAFVLAIYLTMQVHANPTGPTLVSGSALISNPSANVMQVVNTPGTIIDWNAFSIADGETTRFVQLNAASAVLNRVTGNNPSSILGRLESNGRVFLVNPNGIVFGGSSVVDVAGLIASTRDISNENFQAGNYRFEGFGSGSVELEAGAQVLTSVQSPTGGQVWLIAKDVSTATGSTISASDGQVILAAGSIVQVGTSANGNMLFSVTTNGNNSVQALGTIAAERGAVGMFADFVNHQGIITAPNGSVQLHGGAEVRVSPEAVIDADGSQGRIVFESNNLLVYPSGNTHAVGGEVLFLQYEPSSYEAQVPLLLIPSTNTSFFTGESDGVLAIYRQPDGNYAFRDATTQDNYPGPFTFTIYETVLDGMGNIVTPRTAIGSITTSEGNGSGPEMYLAAIQGLPDSYWAPAYPLIYENFKNAGIGMPRIPLANGGWVQIFPKDRPNMSPAARALVAGSDDQVITETTDFAYIVTPLTDGNFVASQLTSGPAMMYDGNGEPLGVSGLFSACQNDMYCRVAYLTPEGGVTMLGTDVVTYGQRSLFSQHWIKVAPDYTPGTPISGEAGVASIFVTRPGAITNTVVPGAAPLPGGDAPPSGDTSPSASDTVAPEDSAPPTVVTGTGSGASFGGISGCNSAVCADNVIRARNVIDAMRAAEAVSSNSSISFMGLSPEDLAALAVALSTGQQASRNNSTGNGNLSQDERAALAVIELARAANREIPSREQALGVAQLMRNNGELRRIINGSVFFPDQTPRQRWEAAQQWLRAEQADQATGSGGNTTVVEEVTVKHLLANMTTEEEVEAFYRDTILPMQLGQ